MYRKSSGENYFAIIRENTSVTSIFEKRKVTKYLIFMGTENFKKGSLVISIHAEGLLLIDKLEEGLLRVMGRLGRLRVVARARRRAQRVAHQPERRGRHQHGEQRARRHALAQPQRAQRHAQRQRARAHARLQPHAHRAELQLQPHVGRARAPAPGPGPLRARSVRERASYVIMSSLYLRQHIK